MTSSPLSNQSGQAVRSSPSYISSSPGDDDLMALLIRSIVYQRIFLAAAATIHKCFYALYPEGFPTWQVVWEGETLSST